MVTETIIRLYVVSVTGNTTDPDLRACFYPGSVNPEGGVWAPSRISVCWALLSRLEVLEDHVRWSVR